MSFPPCSPPQPSRVKLGPNSVEYRIKQEALCFGGSSCTATDIAVAAGVAPQGIGTSPESVANLSPQLVYAGMREIRRLLEHVIDTMKVCMFVRVCMSWNLLLFVCLWVVLR